jgi:hypothetical protein
MSISAIPSSAALPPQAVEAKPSSAAGGSGAQASAPSPIAFQSPVYKIDYPSNIPVEIFRDKQTGAVSNQIPSEQVVKKYELGQMQGQLPNNQSSATAASPASSADKLQQSSGVAGSPRLAAAGDASAGAASGRSPGGGGSNGSGGSATGSAPVPVAPAPVVSTSAAGSAAGASGTTGKGSSDLRV